MNKDELDRKGKQILFLLSQKGRMSLNQICHVMNEGKFFIILSLGSLLKEEKIYIYEKEEEMIIETFHSLSNSYYY
jgi:DNA-binding Lrp family transcriptional regulator